MKRLRLISMISTMLLMAGCGAPLSSPIDYSMPLAAATASTAESGIDPQENENGELVSIEKLSVVFLESFPLQVHAVIHGSLSDSCTSIQRHEVAFYKDTFTIWIFTQKQNDLVCKQGLVPFEYVVPLDVFGLPTGDYTVTAYGNSAQFTFSQDNEPESDGVCTLCFPDPTPEDKE